jgi:beta-glucosidase
MAEQPVYLDPNKPVAERVQDLLGRLTLKEKLSQMGNACPAIPRLGIQAYDYWSEALHGVARNGRATVFPQAIGLGATWDPVLVKAIASAAGDEGRAKFHAAQRANEDSGRYQGLTFWSPNINIYRDPRWGRGQETYGEDPYLSGEMGLAFVRGLQGDDPRYLKAAACAKHFAVHSGPEAKRHTFDARVSLRDLHDTYLPAFQKLVQEGGVEAVMGAYNRVNGEACCAHQLLLEKILQQDWGFRGHVVSDCGAIDDIHSGHHLATTAARAASLALKRGCDLCCGRSYEKLEKAIRDGLASEADLDRALERTLATRFKLGLFDPPELVPYASIAPEVINSPAHRALAYRAALESMVLLKNKDGRLPLDAYKYRRLLVTGPNAASLDALLGNYYGLNEHLTTLLEGIAGAAPEGVQVNYRQGCLLAGENRNPINWAVGEAYDSDLVIACLGLAPALEGEEGESILSGAAGDRTDLRLPPNQVAFLRQLAETGRPIVLVLTGGGPIELGEIEPLVDAILFAWYPGQEGGRAAASLLFGEESPSGRLPVSFPQSAAQLPPFEDYSMQERTYRYAHAEPAYPFGFGLSYTHFAYLDLALDRTSLPAGESLQVDFTLLNAGRRKAEEVAQLYLNDLQASVPVPIHKLVGFQRVWLAPGERRRLAFTLTPGMLSLVNEAGESILEPGRFQLWVGGCSPGGRGGRLGAPRMESAIFEVIGE